MRHSRLDRYVIPGLTGNLASTNPLSTARPGISITVSDLLQRHATEADRAAHIDVADWLIRWKTCTAAPFSADTLRVFEAIAHLFDPELHDEFKQWIEDFGLEINNSIFVT